MPIQKPDNAPRSRAKLENYKRKFGCLLPIFNSRQEDPKTSTWQIRPPKESFIIQTKLSDL